jgi:hypothetical protein
MEARDAQIQTKYKINNQYLTLSIIENYSIFNHHKCEVRYFYICFFAHTD